MHTSLRSPGSLSLSVVIPVRNDVETLRRCLRSVRASTVIPTEVIIVDDGSDEDPGPVAEAFGARIIRMPGRSGPGAARNAGATIACGDVLVFIDTDVCVYPDVLRRMQQHLDADPALDAVFGSYEERAGADNFISWYKNFQHHYIHQRSSADAWTFWSGCGAVRRDVFLAHGGFSTSYRRPAVEDIELGMRLFRAGGKLRLDPHMQATHLKRWNLLSLIRSDLMGRAAPWTELLLRHRRLPADLNLGWSQRASVAFAVLLVAAIVVGCAELGAAFAVPVAAALCLSLAPYWAESLGIGKAMAATALLGGGFSLLVGLTRPEGAQLIAAAVALAYALMLLRVWRVPLRPGGRWRGEWGLTLCFAAAAGLIIGHLPAHWIAAAVIALVAGIVWLNRAFYTFVRARWGVLNTVSAVTFHLIYYLSSAIGCAVGIVTHLLSPRQRFPRTFTEPPRG